MTTSRLHGRRGDGSAVVNGWVAGYTLGLPAALRARRREDIASFLADETADAVRRGTTGALRRRRLLQLVLGIPDDLTWRFVDAPVLARAMRSASTWIPLDRRSSLLLVMAAVGAAGALVLMASAYLQGGIGWDGWGAGGFAVACLGVLAAISLAVPWPGRACVAVIPTVLLGLVAAPWLWGCWALALVAVFGRAYQASTADDPLRR